MTTVQTRTAENGTLVDTTGITAVDAIPMVQAGHRMFVTVLTAEQLTATTVVDRYNSSLAPGDPNQGYQRPPERSRITRIGTYLIKKQGDGLYPNAVLLGITYAFTVRPDVPPTCVA